MSQNIPVLNFPFLYMQGLLVSWVSNTTLSIAAGQCRDSTDSIDIVLGSAPLNGVSVTAPITINAAVKGRNGLDTGSLANNTWYAVYMIADSTYKLPVGAILTLATNTVPIMPAGYDSYRLRYFIRTDGSSHFIPFYMLGTGATITNVWTNTIDMGITTGATSYTALAIDAGAPDYAASMIDFVVSFTPNTAGNAFYLRPTGANATVNTTTTSGSGVVAAKAQILEVTTVALLSSGILSIDYKSSEASDGLLLKLKSFTISV